MRYLIVLLALIGNIRLAHAQSVDPLQAAKEIDGLLEQHWATQKIARNPPITDEIFVRRIYLDLAGRIPAPAETAVFLSSAEPRKRAKLISDLLQRESYVSHFYNYWADVLRYKSQYVNRANVIEAAYAQFIKESLRTNKPYDQFVRELLSAKGYAWDNGAIGYYHRDPEMPLDNMAITTRIFLGTRIECAQCHDHPFDKWKQTEFYHLAAYTHSNRELNEAFDGQRAAMRAREEAINHQYQQEKAAAKDDSQAALARKEQRIAALDNRGVAGIVKGPVGQLFSPIGLQRDPAKELKLPSDFEQADGSPGDVMKPRTIFGPVAEVAPGEDRALALARWMTAPENPRFTRVIVNRLWRKMFGAPLTEAIDDLRDDSVASVPQVEERLIKLMIELQYDMRAFLAILANTQAYQSAVSAEEYELGKPYHFTGPLLRRMTAEQAWDSIITLANHEPDARDLKRLEREQRRIQVSHMAFEAYRHFDGEKLLQMALDRLAAEKDLEKRELAVREKLVIVKRQGDKEQERELSHELGRLNRERGEMRVREYIMPMLENLAKSTGVDGPHADPNYVMNANPSVMGPEAWRRMHVPGFGPPPKSAEELEQSAAAEREKYVTLANNLQIPVDEQAAFIKYCQQANTEWLRASELDSPAPRGHFLRTMGQSDREFVENANPNASIPQALALMNSNLVSPTGILSPYSPLMCYVNQAAVDQTVQHIYLAILSRQPSEKELRRWQAAQGQHLSSQDLIYALLNTKQFLFIQ